MHDVFISYSSLDKAMADAVCNYLETRDIRCWYAPRDIKGGEPWADSIIRAIERAKIFVLLFSKNSNVSDQVLREVTKAINCGCIVVPVRFDLSKMTGNLEYYLEPLHWLDAVSRSLQENLEDLYILTIDILHTENKVSKKNHHMRNTENRICNKDNQTTKRTSQNSVSGNKRTHRTTPRKYRKYLYVALLIAVIIGTALWGAYKFVDLCKVNVYVECNGVAWENDHRYQVAPGDIITVEASSSDSTISFIGYYFSDTGWENRIKEYSNRVEIVVPYAAPDTVTNLFVEPVASNDNGTPNKETKTGWQKYTLEYIHQVSMDITIDGKLLENNGKYHVAGGETVTVTAKSTEADIAFISYYFSSTEKDSMEDKTVVKGNTATFTIPEFLDDEILILSVEPVATNDTGEDNRITKTGWQNYALIYDSQINMQVWLNDQPMEYGGVYEITKGEQVIAEASSMKSPIDRIGYSWDKNEYIDAFSNRLVIPVPDGTPGSVHALYIEAIEERDRGEANTITKTGWQKYYGIYSGTEPSIYGRKIVVTANGTVQNPDTDISVLPGDTIQIYAFPSKAVRKLWYMSGTGDWESVDNPIYQITIPKDAKPGNVFNYNFTAFYSDNVYADGSSNGETSDYYRFIVSTES